MVFVKWRPSRVVKKSFFTTLLGQCRDAALLKELSGEDVPP